MMNSSEPPAIEAYLQSLVHYLQQEVQVSVQDATLFSKWFQFKPVIASQLIYTPQRKVNYVYIVQQGLFRLFRVHKNGAEQTLGFYTEGDWIIDPYAFIEGQPTQLHLQSVEAGGLLVINRTFVSRAMQQFAWYKSLHQQHLSQQVLALQLHLQHLKTFGPYQRYQELMIKQAELMRRIPVELLAGYLELSLDKLNEIKT